MNAKRIEPAFLTADEAARYMGITKSSFDRLTRAASGICGIRIGNRSVYRIRALDAYMGFRELAELLDELGTCRGPDQVQLVNQLLRLAKELGLDLTTAAQLAHKQAGVHDD